MNSMYIGSIFHWESKTWHTNHAITERNKKKWVQVVATKQFKINQWEEASNWFSRLFFWMIFFSSWLVPIFFVFGKIMFSTSVMILLSLSLSRACVCGSRWTHEIFAGDNSLLSAIVSSLGVLADGTFLLTKKKPNFFFDVLSISLSVQIFFDDCVSCQK